MYIFDITLSVLPGPVSLALLGGFLAPLKRIIGLQQNVIVAINLSNP